MYTVITTRDNEIKHLSNYLGAMEAIERFENEKNIAVQQLAHGKSITDFDIYEETDKHYEFGRVVDLYEITVKNHVVQVQMIGTKTPCIYKLSEHTCIKNGEEENFSDTDYIFGSIQNAKERLHTIHHENEAVVEELMDSVEMYTVPHGKRCDYIKERENNIGNRKDGDMNKELGLQLRVHDELTGSYTKYRLYQEEIL